jgi:hypothetical protein
MAIRNVNASTVQTANNAAPCSIRFFVNFTCKLLETK